MKLHYITNSRIPTEKAHGMQIMKMCEAFSDAGFELDLVLPTRKNKNYEKVDPYQYYQVNNNFYLKKLKTFDPVFLLHLPILRPPQGTFIKIQTLLFSFSIYRYLRREKVSSNDFLYTRDQYLIPLLIKFSKNVVWEAHDLPKNKSKYSNYWKKCKKIVAITQGLKDELISLGVDEKNIFVAPDGVDLKMFEPVNSSQEDLRKKLSLPIDKKLILYAGHLYDWKGAQVLAQAASFVSSNAVVAFLGGTDRDIERFKNEYEAKNNILVLGRVDHKEVAKYLQAADVLVLPNSGKSQISAKYTSPLKLFEYMSMKKPIVASALPSIKEVLNSSNSVLVEADNPKDLAKGINESIENKELSSKMADQAYQDVQKYTWHKRAENIYNFLNK